MKLERVVIGIDFSRPSIESARWVARQFAPGADLILVHAISMPEPPPIVRSRFPRRDLLVDTIREGAEKKLRELSLSLSADRVWLEIREGNPVECLDAVAEEYSADVIVAGAHGERTGLLKELGSTAHHLVRGSKCPVLVVTDPPCLTPPSHILVAVEKPESARAALRCATTLARQFDATVTAMHVVSAGVASGALAAAAVLSGTAPVDLGGHRSLTETPDRWLECVVAAGAPRERANSEVAFGEASHELLSAAERLQADLVVMGRRATGNFRRAVLGSVVQGVLHRARCPVLVVPESAWRGSDA
jgi:nucleotide-binding universal stress UspA family protein